MFQRGSRSAKVDDAKRCAMWERGVDLPEVEALLVPKPPEVVLLFWPKPPKPVDPKDIVTAY